MTDMRVNRTGAIRTAAVKPRTAGTGTPPNSPATADPYDFPTPPRFLPALLLGRAVQALIARWMLWRSARRTRAALERLDEASLRDIGLSRGYYGYEPLDDMGRMRISRPETGFREPRR
ncbi:DUF1127 domain-containing protein [Stappia sp. TSB10GB4]|uniref:DUF1127 domain-containing protein n=1 Tax=Stappia sp. TSB10GB4 TaxID=2003584 RepID=UPI001AD8F0BE|nr:DUF1127 domain-containing protein [Stappia sp. TSB10GB4]